MPTYEVTIDDKAYEVDSPTELNSTQAYQAVINNIELEKPAEEQPYGPGGTRVELADGSVVISHPDDRRKLQLVKDGKVVTSDNKRIIPLISEQFRRNRRAGLVEENPFTAGVVNTLGKVPYVGQFADEAMGALPFGADTQTIRDVQKGVDETAPVPAGIGRAAGIGTGIYGAYQMPIIRGTTPLTTAMKLGAAGTAASTLEGGLSGYGSGEGGPTDPTRLKNAMSGAGWGLAIGLPLSFAGGAVQGVLDKRAVEQGARMIAEKLQISFPTAAILMNQIRLGNNLESAISNVRKAGDQGMVADADVAIAQLLDAVAQSGDRAGTLAREAVEGRARASSGELSTIMDDTLGVPPVGKQTAIEQASARTAPQRDAAYDEAFNTPIDYASTAGRNLENMMNNLANVDPKLFNEAIDEANRQMRLFGRENQQIMATIGDDGSITFSEMFNLEQVDFLKSAMQAQARKYTNNIGQLLPEGKALNEMARRLRDTAVEAVPSYAKALQLGQRNILANQALFTSGSLLRQGTSVEDVLKATRNADDTTMQAMRTSLRMEIDDMLGNVKSGILSGGDASIAEGLKLLREMTSGNNIKKMRMIMGEQNYQNLLPKLGVIRKQLELLARVADNSKTQVRKEVMSQIDDVIEGGIVRAAMRGETVNVLQRGIQQLTGATAEADALRKSGILDELRVVLTGMRGKDAEAALRYITEVQKGQELTEPAKNFLVTMLRRAAQVSGRESAQELLAPETN